MWKYGNKSHEYKQQYKPAYQPLIASYEIVASQQHNLFNKRCLFSLSYVVRTHTHTSIGIRKSVCVTIVHDEIKVNQQIRVCLSYHQIHSLFKSFWGKKIYKTVPNWLILCDYEDGSCLCVACNYFTCIVHRILCTVYTDFPFDKALFYSRWVVVLFSYSLLRSCAQ